MDTRSGLIVRCLCRRPSLETLTPILLLYANHFILILIWSHFWTAGRRPGLPRGSRGVPWEQTAPPPTERRLPPSRTRDWASSTRTSRSRWIPWTRSDIRGETIPYEDRRRRDSDDERVGSCLVRRWQRHSTASLVVSSLIPPSGHESFDRCRRGRGFFFTAFPSWVFD